MYACVVGAVQLPSFPTLRSGDYSAALTLAINPPSSNGLTVTLSGLWASEVAVFHALQTGSGLTFQPSTLTFAAGGAGSATFHISVDPTLGTSLFVSLLLVFV